MIPARPTVGQARTQRRYRFANLRECLLCADSKHLTSSGPSGLFGGSAENTIAYLTARMATICLWATPPGISELA
jgi:hypothetical protein